MWQLLFMVRVVLRHLLWLCAKCSSNCVSNIVSIHIGSVLAISRLHLNLKIESERHHTFATKKKTCFKPPLAIITLQMHRL
ncbi:hypothetical protein E4T56_gene307 [Termitomyces sp. T112]|nr:hypothetical protein E4T56_gene307 [Termitomyces sp. T112]